MGFKRDFPLKAWRYSNRDVVTSHKPCYFSEASALSPTSYCFGVLRMRVVWPLSRSCLLSLYLLMLITPLRVQASLGDHLPEFRECVSVSPRDRGLPCATNDYRHASPRTVGRAMPFFVCEARELFTYQADVAPQLCSFVFSSGLALPIAIMFVSTSSRNAAWQEIHQC